MSISTPGGAAFEAACRRAPEELVRSSHVVGGRPLHLAVVGRELHAFLSRPALPLTGATPGDEQGSLRIELWDSSVAGERGERPQHDTERATFGGWPRALRIEEPTRTEFWGPAFELSLDRERRTVGGFVTGARALRETWHPARPLHPVLMPWQLDLGHLVIHAGCVQTERGAVLLAGASGAGKSTSVIASGLAGLPVLGDDAVAVGLTGDGRPLAHCVNASVKLTMDGAHRFPAAARRAEVQSGIWRGDSVLFLAELEEVAVPASSEVAAVVFPQTVASAGSHLDEISGAEALRRLTGATLSASRDRIAASFSTLAALTERVPMRKLAVGRNPERIPEAIEAAAP